MDSVSEPATSEKQFAPDVDLPTWSYIETSTGTVQSKETPAKNETPDPEKPAEPLTAKDAADGSMFDSTAADSTTTRLELPKSDNAPKLSTNCNANIFSFENLPIPENPFPQTSAQGNSGSAWPPKFPPPPPTQPQPVTPLSFPKFTFCPSASTAGGQRPPTLHTPSLSSTADATRPRTPSLMSMSELEKQKEDLLEYKDRVSSLKADRTKFVIELRAAQTTSENLRKELETLREDKALGQLQARQLLASEKEMSNGLSRQLCETQKHINCVSDELTQSYTRLDALQKMVDKQDWIISQIHQADVKSKSVMGENDELKESLSRLGSELEETKRCLNGRLKEIRSANESLQSRDAQVLDLQWQLKQCVQNNNNLARRNKSLSLTLDTVRGELDTVRSESELVKRREADLLEQIEGLKRLSKLQMQTSTELISKLAQATKGLEEERARATSANTQIREAAQTRRHLQTHIEEMTLLMRNLPPPKSAGHDSGQFDEENWQREAEIRTAKEKIQRMRELEEEERRHREEKEAAELEKSRRAAEELEKEEKRQRDIEENKRRLQEQKAAREDEAWSRASSAEEQRCFERDIAWAKKRLPLPWDKATAFARVQKLWPDFSPTQYQTKERPLTPESIIWPILDELYLSSSPVPRQMSWENVEQFFKFAKQKLSTEDYTELLHNMQRGFHPDKFTACLLTAKDESRRKDIAINVNTVSQVVNSLKQIA